MVWAAAFTLLHAAQSANGQPKALYPHRSTGSAKIGESED